MDTQSQLQPAQSLRGTEPEATVDRPGDWRGTFLQSFHAIAIVTILIFISIQLPITIAGSQSLPSSQETGISSLSSELLGPEEVGQTRKGVGGAFTGCLENLHEHRD